MNLEERIIELERTINLLLQKDKEVDKFCEEILNAVQENNNLIVRITKAQIVTGEIIQTLTTEVKKLQA